MKITEEMFALAEKLGACQEGIARARLGFEFLNMYDKIWIARKKEAPVDFLAKLSTDEDSVVKTYVAANPSTPVDTLGILSADNIWHVREGVADNLSTPLKILTVLFDDQDWAVRHAACINLTKRESK